MALKFKSRSNKFRVAVGRTRTGPSPYQRWISKQDIVPVCQIVKCRWGLLSQGGKNVGGESRVLEFGASNSPRLGKG